MKKHLQRMLCATAMLGICSTMSGQSASWIISPKYQSVTRLSPTLFLVQSNDSKAALMDTDGNVTNLTKKKKDKYKYVDKNGKKVTQSIEEIVASMSAQPSDSTPCAPDSGLCTLDSTFCTQFKSLQSFVNGFAIAETADGTGVLKWIPESYKCKIIANEIEDNMEETVFMLTIPKECSGMKYRMYCKDSTGLEYEADGQQENDSTATFAIKTFREKRTFHIDAINKNKDALTVWQLVTSLIEVEKSSAEEAKPVIKPKTKGKTKTKAKGKAKPKARKK